MTRLLPVAAVLLAGIWAAARWLVRGGWVLPPDLHDIENDDLPAEEEER